MPMNDRKHLSQRDIAQALGVTVSTVSRALSGAAGVGEEVRARIKAYAEAHHYQPNPFALSLRYDVPRIIGVIVPDIATHFFSSIIKSIETTALEHGYFTILMSSNECADDEVRDVRNLLSMHVSGMIICLSQQTRRLDHILEVCEGGTPVVLFDRVALPDKLSSVTIDDSASAYQATRYLIESGSRRIAFLGGANHLGIVSNRKHGYIRALKEAGLAVDPRLVACHEISFNAGLVDTLALLEAQPDALLAMNDTLAFAAMEAIKSRGMVIPDDIRLIGYTDETHANYLTPKLTAVRHNTRLIGEQACRLLLEQIGGDTAVRHITVPTHLEIRKTT